MDKIIMIYITLLSPILAGIMNMLFCKLPILNYLHKPIDMGKKLRDGKRILGDNKTWKGIVGYVVLNIIFSVLFGLIASYNNFMATHNYFYINHQNTLVFNILLGILLGLGYSLFELPNSFIKRRLDITPGKTVTGVKKILFVFMDQVDSVLGCVLIVRIFYPLGLIDFIVYILIGALTHLILNMLLYFLHLRKNMF